MIKIQNFKKALTTNYQQLTAKSGAALLITMVIIATVGALVLALGRLALSELRITTTLTDSTIAYYAAEAGLEKGLLEFRLNKNKEIISEEQDLSQILGLGLGYQLTSTYLVTFIGGQYDRKFLPKDQTLQIDFPATNKPDQLNFNWQAVRNPPGLTQGIIEYSFIHGMNGEITDTHIFPSAYGGGDLTCPLVPPIPPYFYPGIPSGILTINISTIPNPKKLIIKYLSCDPNSTGMNYWITSSPNTGKFGGPNSTISSLGSFEKSQRKLEATVSRRTGTLLGIFEYVLYGGEGNIQP